MHLPRRTTAALFASTVGLAMLSAPAANAVNANHGDRVVSAMPGRTTPPT